MITKTNIVISLLFLTLAVAAAKPKANKKAPKGMVVITQSLFMDATEVSVAQYFAFYNQTLADSGAAIAAKYFPDTAQVSADLGIHSSLYFYGKTYQNHPIIGISYEQATAFCDWKTAQYNKQQAAKYNPSLAKKLYFRLPTREEWMYAAEANTGNQLFWWGESFASRNSRPLLQAYFDINDGIVKDFSLTAPVKYFQPNPFGLYNMHGNVAEMTWIKGIAIGGSFNHVPTECVVVSKQNYVIAGAWLGFRCAAQIIEE